MASQEYQTTSAEESASEFNCSCSSTVIASVMGVERCATCGKLAGSSVMVPFGSPLPTKGAKRVRTGRPTLGITRETLAAHRPLTISDTEDGHALCDALTDLVAGR